MVVILVNLDGFGLHGCLDYILIARGEPKWLINVRCFMKKCSKKMYQRKLGLSLNC